MRFKIKLYMLGKKKAHAFWFSRKWLSKSYDHDMIWNVGCYKLKWLLYVEEGCIYAAQHKPNQRDSLRPQLTRGSLFTLDSIPYIIILLHIFFSLEFQQGIIWRDSFYYILKKQHVKSINSTYSSIQIPAHSEKQPSTQKIHHHRQGGAD